MFRNNGSKLLTRRISIDETSGEQLHLMNPVRVFNAADGSKKYRFQLDGHLGMEAAFFHVANRTRPNIACVSSQLGCAVGCPFCAASSEGLIRNLTADEILLQVSTVIDEGLAEGASEESFEVSLMGMGEPLANLKNLLEAINGIHRRYPLISRVSVSTAGPAKSIDGLNSSMPIRPTVHLQISLHATNDATRRMLVPHAQESISRLLDAGRRFHQKTDDHVCLNYVLLHGMNDSMEDARWLRWTASATHSN